MAWTKEDYKMAFGQAWDDPHGFSPWDIAQTRLKVEERERRVRDMTKAMPKYPKVSLAVEDEMARHINKDFDEILRSLDKLGSYEFRLKDGNKVKLYRERGKVTGGLVLPLQPKKTVHKSAKRRPALSELPFHKPLIARLGSALWRMFRPMLNPVHEWLKVKDNGKEK